MKDTYYLLLESGHENHPVTPGKLYKARPSTQGKLMAFDDDEGNERVGQVHEGKGPFLRLDTCAFIIFSEPQAAEIQDGLDEGFTWERDSQRGHNWPKFRRGEEHVWISRRGWIHCFRAGDRYVEHTVHGTLLDALKGINGKPL